MLCDWFCKRWSLSNHQRPGSSSLLQHLIRQANTRACSLGSSYVCGDPPDSLNNNIHTGHRKTIEFCKACDHLQETRVDNALEGGQVIDAVCLLFFWEWSRASCHFMCARDAWYLFWQVNQLIYIFGKMNAGCIKCYNYVDPLAPIIHDISWTWVIQSCDMTVKTQRSVCTRSEQYIFGNNLTLIFPSIKYINDIS